MPNPMKTDRDVLLGRNNSDPEAVKRRRDPTEMTRMRIIPADSKERIWRRACVRELTDAEPGPLGPDFLWWVLDMPDTKPVTVLERG